MYIYLSNNIQLTVKRKYTRAQTLKNRAKIYSIVYLS